MTRLWSSAPAPGPAGLWPGNNNILPESQVLLVLLVLMVLTVLLSCVLEQNSSVERAAAAV